MARVRASTRSVPKNCRPALGGRFGFVPCGTPVNLTSGPKVESMAFGPKVPACSGPATNSQNGSNSVNRARGRIVAMRGRVVHVARDPDDVPDLSIADEAEDLGKLQLTPECLAVEGVGDRLEVIRTVAHDQPDRHAVRDHFPHRLARRQGARQPRHLRRPHDAALVAERRLVVHRVRAAVAAQIEREHVDERTAADNAIQPFGIVANDRHRVVFEERLPSACREQGRALRRVARIVRQIAGRIPVVAHLMIVPADDLRHARR